jgi:Matrixin
MLVSTMGPYHNLSVNIILISILTALASMPYLSSSQYATAAAAAHSSSSRLHTDARENGIQVCCSWGNQISDGVLTYRIDNGAKPQVIQAVHQAVDEWNSKVPDIQLQEVTNTKTPVDIDIKTNSKAPKVTHAVSTIVGGGHSKISAGKNIKLVQPGEANINFNPRGLITHVDITISTKALGNSIGLSELESITKHEIGHAYGIGHTDFVNDLMSPVLTGRTSTDISQCDIKGIAEANSSPHAPSPQFLRC